MWIAVPSIVVLLLQDLLDGLLGGDVAVGVVHRVVVLI